MHNIRPIFLFSQDIYSLEFDGYVLSRLFITLREQHGSFHPPLFPSADIVEEIFKELKKFYAPLPMQFCSKYVEELLYVVTIMLGSIALSDKDMIGHKQSIQIPGFDFNIKNQFQEFIYIPPSQPIHMHLPEETYAAKITEQINKLKEQFWLNKIEGLSQTALENMKAFVLHRYSHFSQRILHNISQVVDISDFVTLIQKDFNDYAPIYLSTDSTYSLTSFLRDLSLFIDVNRGNWLINLKSSLKSEPKLYNISLKVRLNKPEITHFSTELFNFTFEPKYVFPEDYEKNLKCHDIFFETKLNFKNVSLDSAEMAFKFTWEKCQEYLDIISAITSMPLNAVPLSIEYQEIGKQFKNAKQLALYEYNVQKERPKEMKEVKTLYEKKNEIVERFKVAMHFYRKAHCTYNVDPESTFIYLWLAIESLAQKSDDKQRCADIMSMFILSSIKPTGNVFAEQGLKNFFINAYEMRSQGIIHRGKYPKINDEVLSAWNTRLMSYMATPLSLWIKILQENPTLSKYQDFIKLIADKLYQGNRISNDLKTAIYKHFK